MRTYAVTIERDGRGWLASIPSVPGAHTQGRTIDQARRRIREALGLWVADSDRAELRFEVKLPATIRRQVERVIALREEADRTNRNAAAALVLAVCRLTDQGLSRRDAGELLGISRQRAQQLTEIDHLTSSAPQLSGASHAAGLTAREVDVLVLLSRGLTRKQIAQELTISAKTVSNHEEHIYAKLGVRSRGAAALFATRHGLIGVDAIAD